MHKTCFCVATWSHGIALGGNYAAPFQKLTFVHCRQCVRRVFVLVFVVSRLAINFQKAVECNYFARGYELQVGCFVSFRIEDGNRDSGLVYLGICHLRCCRALPDKVVKTFLLTGSVYVVCTHVGWTDSLVGFLCPLAAGVIFPSLTIFGAI